MSDSSNTSRPVQRGILAIPDQPYSGFVAYDAKDPDSRFAPIQELLPPQGAPNVLIVLLDDVGFGASSAFGSPCQTPDRGTTGGQWLALHAFSHHSAVLAHARRAALRPQPPHGGDGRNYGDCDFGAGL